MVELDEQRSLSDGPLPRHRQMARDSPGSILAQASGELLHLPLAIGEIETRIGYRIRWGYKPSR